ncbi:hypothetical protein LIER_40015 [Lithospermum erythrorhizon]|uniref:Uncharacterized protein n=1 Tax=Lithospermum erythrorhizon TaxID=34254 RepID=A0AAV3QNZ9_LITER
MIEEDLLEDYKLLYTKWTELTVMYTKVDAERCKLKVENEGLRKLGIDRAEEVHNLKAPVNALNKGLRMMNSSTNILEEILEIGKEAGDNTCISFEKGKLTKPKEGTTFAQAGWIQQPRTVGTSAGYRRRRSTVWYCHYYGKKGHIASYC